MIIVTIIIPIKNKNILKKEKKMKIGFFDSGLGGVTVLKEAMAQIPATYLYLADTLHTPYGTKPKQLVTEYTKQNIAYLVDQQCDAIVVACNTATSLAIDTVRKTFPQIPIIGTEPAVKVAVENSTGNRILVVATTITTQEEKLKNLISQLHAQDMVDVLALDGLVPLAEKEGTTEEEVRMYLETMLFSFPIQQYEYVVLGCTHFPIFRNIFQEIFPKYTHVIDGSDGIVKQLIQQLKLTQIEILAEESQIQVVLTKQNDVFLKRFYTLLPTKSKIIPMPNNELIKTFCSR